MTPQLSHRVGRALAEHWVSFDEREQVVRAINRANRWSDLPPDVQALVTKIESRPLVLDGRPPAGLRIRRSFANPLPPLPPKGASRRTAELANPAAEVLEYEAHKKLAASLGLRPMPPPLWLRYNPDQPRDDHGRFGEGDGGGDSGGDSGGAGASASFSDRAAAAASNESAIASAPSGAEREDSGLNESQAQAFESYRGFFGYRAINGQLRSGEPSGKAGDEIAHMDSAMQSSHLTEDAVTYRGVSNSANVFGEAAQGDLTGAEWSEPAFFSTSASETFANNWAKNDGPDSATRAPLVMRVLSPSGTPAVAMSEGDRGELLLDRGMSYRVAADHGVVDGVRQIDVEVVGK